VDYN
jgi:hypothetical protein